jgi:hypothetical protein
MSASAILVKTNKNQAELRKGMAAHEFPAISTVAPLVAKTTVLETSAAPLTQLLRSAFEGMA